MSVVARDKTDNKRLFGFSFTRLMEAGGATLYDGQHELYIYKCEDRARLDPNMYLLLPSSSRDDSGSPISSSPFSRSSKEAVFIHTLLCSTKLTQNGTFQFCHILLTFKYYISYSVFGKPSLLLFLWIII